MKRIIIMLLCSAFLLSCTVTRKEKIKKNLAIMEKSLNNSILSSIKEKGRFDTSDNPIQVFKKAIDDLDKLKVAEREASAIETSKLFLGMAHYNMKNNYKRLAKIMDDLNTAFLSPISADPPPLRELSNQRKLIKQQWALVKDLLHRKNKQNEHSVYQLIKNLGQRCKDWTLYNDLIDEQKAEISIDPDLENFKRALKQLDRSLENIFTKFSYVEKKIEKMYNKKSSKKVVKYD